MDAVPGFALSEAPVVLPCHLAELYGIFMDTWLVGVLAQTIPRISISEGIILLAKDDSRLVIKTGFVKSHLLKKRNQSTLIGLDYRWIEGR